MLFRSSCFFTILLCFYSCYPNQIHSANHRNKSIKGDWVLENPKAVNYGILEFNTDSTAIFSSRGDTLYRFTYFVKESNLILTNNFNSDRESYKIIHLDENKLIFTSFREKKEKQYYKRKD